jgi:sn-glycerol 3-phosphate transport system permease protein
MANAPKPRRHIRLSDVFDHGILIVGSLFMILPVVMLLQMTTMPDLVNMRTGPSLSIGDQIDDNFYKAMFKADGFAGENTGLRML